MESDSKNCVTHRNVKEISDLLILNKENIPGKHITDTHKKSSQSRVQNTKLAKLKCGSDKSLLPVKTFIKRLPLKDLPNDLKKSSVLTKHANFKNQTQDKKSINQKDKENKEAKDLKNETIPNSKNKICNTVVHGKNILKSSLSNIPNVENACAQDTALEVCILDTKLITFDRNFDSVKRNDDLIEKLDNNNDSLGFNESDFTSIENIDAHYSQNIEIYNTNEIIDANPYPNVFNLSSHIKIDCTPVNTYFPNSFNDIKQKRKNTLKNLSIENEIQNNVFLQEKSNEKISSNTTLQTKASIESVLSPLPPLLENNTYDNSKERQKDFTTTYRIQGAVHLDNQENFVFHKVLYSTTYLNFIMRHQLTKEYKHQLSNEFLKKFHITDMNRSIVINWLLKLQAYMRTEHVLVYTAVRIMDRTIDSMEIPLNMLQLVALASYWISLKFHAVDHKNVSWMVKQTRGAYNYKELADMERKVYVANHFDVDCVDSSIFIHFYVLKLDLSNADIVAHCAHYLLDCALLDSRFVRTLPSMMAAAAVFTSLHLLKQYSGKNWTKLCCHCGYYPPDELIPVRDNIIEVLKEVNNPTFQCREPYYKYCSSRYFGIAHIVLDSILLNNF